MENVMKQFREIQTEAEERFREWEEMRWQRECEIEEKRRKEDREHERLMLQMILQHGQQPHQTSQPPYSGYSHAYQHPMYQPFDEEH